MTILHTFWGMRRVGSAATAVALAVALACTGGQAGGQKRPKAETNSGRGAEPQTVGQQERIRKIEATAVDIPMGFTEMLARAPDLALAWRICTRAIFTTYFDRGYRAVDFLLDRPGRRGTYLLTRH